MADTRRGILWRQAWAGSGVAGAWLAVVALAGCAPATRQKLLNVLIDGASGPSPPTRRLHRDYQREIDDLKRQLADTQAQAARLEQAASGQAGPAAVALPVEQASTWPEAQALLPKRPSGDVDWDEALMGGLVAPRSALSAQEAAPAVFDLDVDVATSGRPTFRASFSHAGHTRWVGCQSCHPSLFPLSARTPPPPITMRGIARRQFCGACHGSVAFRVANACSRCHTAVPARADWQAVEPLRAPIEAVHRWEEAERMLPASDGAPLWTSALVAGTIQPRADVSPAASASEPFASDVEWIPEAGQDFRVVFPHAPHTAWLACASCHPDPFAMRAHATPMTMDEINAGKFCGTCHGSVSFPLSACGRCHPAMETGP